MKKMKLHTPDLTEGNIDRIAALFPNCVTEAMDEAGQLKRAIDFDLLRQELAADVVEGPQERYRLDWPGKRAALALANAPIDLTLRPCPEESVDFENTQNLYIEGDNLDALKLLQETYLGKVKMIYIDPPYNTGNDFIYDDDFSMSRDDYSSSSGAVDEEGNVMFDEEKWKQNSTSNGRFHSEWLSMMYPRLKLARNLLSDDGVIFISIDDNEDHNLKKVCDEVFGAQNHIVSSVWHKRVSPANDAHWFSSDHDLVLIYAKDRIFWSPRRLPRNESQLSYYKNPDNDDRGSWNSATYTCNKNSTERPNLYYGITNPHTGEEVWPQKNAVWKYSKEVTEKNLADNRIFWGAKNDALPRIKLFLSEMEGVVPRSIWSSSDFGHTQEATTELKALFQGRNLFDSPKPVKLLRMCCELAGLSDGSIILDFFSGSATTAHAVMQLNAEDCGKRRNIMVQLPEPCDEKSEAYKAGYQTIAEIGKERIRRAGQKILSEWHAKQAAAAENLKLETENSGGTPPDIGFRVLKIDSSNFRDVQRTPDELDQAELSLHTEHIKPDRTPQDLLFQVLVDWGVDLSLPIREENITAESTNSKGKKESKEYTVYWVDENVLAACFDAAVPESLIHTIAARKPLRAVFRDESYDDDSTRINVEQIFKLLSPGTEVKSL